MSKMTEHELLLREGKKIVEGLAKTLSPMCEVVLHDLRTPDHAIVMIENNLSGRDVGGSATELGLARIADPNFPDVVANYANQFPDGRTVKSTSIGLKDSKGHFVAAICLNIDTSYLRSVATYLGEITRVETEGATVESLEDIKASIETRIRQFSSQRNKTPSSLSSGEKRTLVQALSDEGFLEQRGAAEKIAKLLGSTRSSVYYYLGKGKL